MVASKGAPTQIRSSTVSFKRRSQKARDRGAHHVKTAHLGREPSGYGGNPGLHPRKLHGEDDPWGGTVPVRGTLGREQTKIVPDYPEKGGDFVKPNAVERVFSHTWEGEKTPQVSGDLKDEFHNCVNWFVILAARDSWKAWESQRRSSRKMYVGSFRAALWRLMHDLQIEAHRGIHQYIDKDYSETWKRLG